MKHSPGPWKWNHDGRTRLLDADGEMVSGDCGCGGPTSVANARLIEAAPALLEALKRLLELFVSQTEPGDWPPDGFEKADVEADALIASLEDET